MKALRLPDELARQIVSGDLTHLLLVDENLDMNDHVEVINANTNKVVGSLTIDEITMKKLGSFHDSEMVLANDNGEQITDPEVIAQKVSFGFVPTSKKSQVDEKVVSKTTKITEVKVYGDGGSRGNPGPAAAGWVVLDMSDKIIKEGGLYMGITTNNQAEYTALKMALQDAKTMGAKRVQVYMDSLLVINQIKGIYKIRKVELMPHFNAINKLAGEFEHITFTHVPRALNKEADRMVNETLDRELGLL